MSNTKYRTEGQHERPERRPGSSIQDPPACRGEEQHGESQRPGGPGADEREVQRAQQLSRRRRGPQHLDAGQIFCALCEERPPVRRRSTRGDDEWHGPGRASGDERSAGRRQHRRPVSQAMAEHDQHEKRQGEPRNLGSNADCRRRHEARGDHPAAARHRQQQRLNRERRRQAGDIAERPGRGQPVQGTRQRDTRGNNSPAPGPGRIDACEQGDQRPHAQRAGDVADQPEGRRLVRHDGVHQLAGGDIDRIAGRVGLMPRDIEVAHAEGEVDRVQIFKGGRKKRQVQRQEQNRQSRGRRKAPQTRCRIGSVRLAGTLHG